MSEHKDGAGPPGERRGREEGDRRGPGVRDEGRVDAHLNVEVVSQNRHRRIPECMKNTIQ